jgi:2-dehydropantoate 2-reductase
MKKNRSPFLTPFHIAGVGSIGGLIAGQFCKHAVPTALILKNKKQLLDYQKSQLTLIHPKERFTCSPPAYEIPQIPGKIKYLIICVKAYDVMRVLDSLKNNLTEESLVILIHNGLGIHENIKESYPHLKIILGISTLSAYLEYPFTINCFMDGKIHLGVLNGEFTKNEINSVRSIFRKARIHFLWRENIAKEAWKKFAINCSVNILTVLFSCKNGELLKHKTLLKELSTEISLILKACEVKISAEILFKEIVRLLVFSSDSYSSMYQDVKNAKNTELEYLNIHLVKLAKQKNIRADLNIKLIEQFNRSKLNS